MLFEGNKGDTLKFQSGLFSRSVKVTDGHNELMQTKSERFKLASRHDVYIEGETYHPAMLMYVVPSVLRNFKNNSEKTQTKVYYISCRQ